MAVLIVLRKKQRWLLVKQFPGIDIKTYETWGNEDHREMLEELAEAYGTSVQGYLALLVITWIGYSDSINRNGAQISECKILAKIQDLN